ncbi:molybdopterin molybdotransferase MoeA [soil metagenome]
MIPLVEARAFVFGRLGRLAPVALPLGDALGCVVADAVEAPEPVPPFDNTAMDGFAVRADDTAGAPVTLAIAGMVAAGTVAEGRLEAGQAARIMTGAPIPSGADAVVMVELTSVSADGASVTVERAARPGDHVRRAGEDVRRGQAVVEPGTVLTAGRLGVLASVGAATVNAVPPARVGVLSTGDELFDGPGPLQPGQIRDSNRRTLLALVAQAGCQPVDLGLVRDDADAIAAAICSGADACDALLTSGGVSMGDFDYVKTVLDSLGEMRWMPIAIQPAQPFAFGTVGNTPVFGLPGNPVSSMVSFELLARPALRHMMGHAAVDRLRVTAEAAGGLTRRPDGKVHFVRVVLTYSGGRFRVTSAGGQGSHQLSAMAAANALAVLPDGDGAPPGAPVEVMVLGELDALYQPASLSSSVTPWRP